jgi:hypothetical protein
MNFKRNELSHNSNIDFHKREKKESISGAYLNFEQKSQRFYYFFKKKLKKLLLNNKLFDLRYFLIIVVLTHC